MIVWIGDRFKEKAPNHGPCPYCDRDVHSWYPWWTANPDRKEFNGAKPVHAECFFKDDTP